MGANTSHPIIDPIRPVRSGFSTMCVTFQYHNRINVLYLDQVGLSVIRQAIVENWTPGILEENTKCGSAWTFKLRGRPFQSDPGLHLYLQAQQMVLQILQNLLKIGWKIEGTNFLGRVEDRSTLFFHRCLPEFSSSSFVSIGLRNSDTLAVSNLPAELVVHIRNTIGCSWSWGIQKVSQADNTLIVKLSGNPWRSWKSGDEQTVMAKVLLQNIIARLRRHQWGYYCNINLNCSSDSLVFRHDASIGPGDNREYCSISFNQRDRLHMIHTPMAIVLMIRGLIRDTWSVNGIQAEWHYHDSREFKLSGSPWYSSKKESVKARFLVLKILDTMSLRGWRVVGVIDVSRRPTDKSALIFEKCEPKNCPMMCLSLNDQYTLHLIQLTEQLVDLLKNTLTSRWPKGISDEERLAFNFGEVLKLKLRGRPWRAGEKTNALHARSLLCNIIDEFRQRGWILLVCADVASKLDYHEWQDVNSTSEYPADLHSMWFVHDPAALIPRRCSSPGRSYSHGSDQAQCNNDDQRVPYLHPTGTHVSGQGIQRVPHVPQHEPPPPTYEEAMGLNAF